MLAWDWSLSGHSIRVLAHLIGNQACRRSGLTTRFRCDQPDPGNSNLNLESWASRHCGFQVNSDTTLPVDVLLVGEAEIYAKGFPGGARLLA
jgi:hypothetical protein